MGDSGEQRVGGEVTQLLARMKGGDASASARLIPLIYDDLHRRAEALMRRESSGHTLQATALVHDAYMKLVGDDRATFRDRQHFFAIAAQTMRRVLVDHARGRLREKRGGGGVKVSLDEGLGLSVAVDADVIALDDVLRRLQALDPRQAQIVELRFFGGLSVEEVAAVLEVSKRTVEAEWTMVSAWLRRELTS